MLIFSFKGQSFGGRPHDISTGPTHFFLVLILAAALMLHFILATVLGLCCELDDHVCSTSMIVPVSVKDTN